MQLVCIHTHVPSYSPCKVNAIMVSLLRMSKSGQRPQVTHLGHSARKLLSWDLNRRSAPGPSLLIGSHSPLAAMPAASRQGGQRHGGRKWVSWASGGWKNCTIPEGWMGLDTWTGRSGHLDRLEWAPGQARLDRQDWTPRQARVDTRTDRSGRLDRGDWTPGQVRLNTWTGG